MGSMKDLLGDTPYPATPGFVQASETSRAAAASMVPTAGTLCARVLAHIKSKGSVGATCDEIELAFDGRHQTISARVRELSLGGQIQDRGGKRKTRSGRNAVVYVERSA